jgi:4-methyl-5(b-hydroxyethyl)-thiazole monophosphate biosynthesis
MPSVVTVLAPGFEETETVTFIDLLRRAGVTVTILGLDGREVTGSHGMTLVADTLFRDFSGPFDGIVLPGGMPGTRNLADSVPLLDLIRRTHERGGLCAAICAAPTVLGTAGILAGCKATCYPGCEKELGEATFVESEVVRDRNIITSRGVGTAIPFALELIAYLVNPDAAEKVKKAIIYK